MIVLSRSIPFLLLAICTSWLTPANATARIWYVKVDGTGDVPRFQDAVDVAQPGDVVLVGPGRYTWTNQGPASERGHGLIELWIDRPRGVTYISEEGPENTILDAEGQNRVVFANGNNDPRFPVEFVFSGFTITGGVAPEAPPEPLTQGGGLVLHLTYPIIENCIFIDNEAETGGGAFVGGINAALFRDCQFIDNRALAGAGMLIMHSFEETVVEDCTFIGNLAFEYDTGQGGTGGGLFCLNNKYRVERCTFYGNRSADTGAAFYSFNSKPGIVRYNSFRDNRNEDFSVGAAVYHRVDTDYLDGASQIEFSNNLIASNNPAKAMVYETAVVMDMACNNIYGNSGGNWIDNLASHLERDGNIQENPMFCVDDGGYTWTVSEYSPMLAANNSCATNIGRIDDGGACGNFEPPEIEPEIRNFLVHTPAPNPFLPSANNATTLSFELPLSGPVTVVVYDISGRKVKELESSFRAAGANTVAWSGRDESGSAVAAGVYLMRVQSEAGTASERVVVIR